MNAAETNISETSVTVKLTELELANFWEKVDKSPNEKGCWNWTGSRRRGAGYGGFWVGGKQWGAHRISYIIKHGSIPFKLCVLHNCDIMHCVNPDHLWVGTHTDNMRDAAKKGRQHFQLHPENNRHGEDSNFAKLTEGQVLEIRRRYIPRKVTMETLGKEFGVCFQHIDSIVRREVWKHLPEEQGAAH